MLHPLLLATGVVSTMSAAAFPMKPAAVEQQYWYDAGAEGRSESHTSIFANHTKEPHHHPLEQGELVDALTSLYDESQSERDDQSDRGAGPAAANSTS